MDKFSASFKFVTGATCPLTPGLLPRKAGGRKRQDIMVLFSYMRLNVIKNSILLLSTLAILTTIGGCGSGSGQQGVSAKGKVELDGAAVSGVSIRFVPQEGVAGRGGVGVTDSTGVFDAQSGQGATGILPGTYRVLLEQLVMADGSPIPPDVAPIDVNARNLLPPIYSDPSKSPVVVTVPDGGSEDMLVQIKSKP